MTASSSPPPPQHLTPGASPTGPPSPEKTQGSQPDLNRPHPETPGGLPESERHAKPWRAPGGWLWLVLALLVAVGWLYAQSRKGASRPQYATRRVDHGPLDEVVLTTGNLQPVLTVNVGSQISGQVRAVYVDFNSVVHKGQVLARLDPRTLQAQREQTEADLHNAQAALLNARSGIANARTGIAAADAGIAAAKANVAVAHAAQGTAAALEVQAHAAVLKAQAQVRLARLTYQRNQQLVRERFAAPQDVDTALATLVAAQADLRNALGQEGVAHAGVASARANLGNTMAGLATARVKRATALAQLDSARAQGSQANAQLEKTQALLRQILINLDYLEIRSPVDGVILSRQVDPGQTVAASFQTPLLFLVATNLRQMQVLATVDESDISHVFVGQQVSFGVNAWPGEVFRGGRVVSIRNATQNIQNVITYPVLIAIHNQDLRLRPGMTANLTMLYAHRADCIRVPNSALRFHPPGSATAPLGMAMAWQITPQGLQARLFRPGISDGVSTEVRLGGGRTEARPGRGEPSKGSSPGLRPSQGDPGLRPGEEVVVGLAGSTPGASPSAVLRMPR